MGRSAQRRRKRRRRNGRDQVNTSPSSRHWGTSASSAEDADASSTSSLEVKENQEDKVHEGCVLLHKYHPSTFYRSFHQHRHRALKRKQLLVDGTKQRLHRSLWSWSQKNALVQLNELVPGLRYDTAANTGPLHAPVFSVAVEVNGLRFEGRGPTKKRAKLRAAELALRSLVQVPGTSCAPAKTLDFTADRTDLLDSVLHHSTTEQRHRQLVQLTLDLEQLGPVALLNQLCPGLRYLCRTEQVPGWPVRRFVMAVRLEGRVFEGCAHSKRRAKAQAAAAALRALHSWSLGPETRPQDSGTKHQLPQLFAESIFRLVRDKYTEVMHGSFSTSHTRHKVLAGIVLTQGSDLASARVVCLATGTKCLDPNTMSERVSTLSDCHAEVVCRRALLRFLYAELELLLRQPTEAEDGSVFIPDEVSGGFRLRNHVRLHMFVSSSPCGDARLGCPYETTAQLKAPQCPGRFRCRLRVKANGGEGTRRAHGREGASSMSCTDKMAKWSVVGLQGALLSRLVEPVYLHSLTVATLTHTGQLGRTMARRLAAVRHLPFPYRRQRLLLGCLSSTEVRPTGKAPNVSMNWTCGDAGLEEISTSTGRRTGSGGPSRLCRRSLMARWQKLQQQFNIPGPEAGAATYAASKAAAGRYQRAVQRFGSGLQDAGLGTWLRKPPEPAHISAAGSYCV